MDDAWSKLAPHRPLDGGALEYAERPEGSGAALAAQVRAGWRRIAVVGPMGVGKSTELAAAQQALQTDRFAFRIGIDLTFDMGRIQAGAVFAHILTKFAEASLNTEARRALNLAEDLADGRTRDIRRDSARKALRAAGSVALLVDGLEKAEPSAARALAEELFALGDDADIVLVVPTSLAYGSGAAILGEDVRPFPIRPVRVWSTVQVAGGPMDGEPIRAMGFLRDVALRHLGQVHLASEGLEQVIFQASSFSGGVPRVLLQLLRDAHRHAIVAGRRGLLPADLEQAKHDHGEQLRRSLLPGDVDALLKAEGQDGTEVPIDRKLRFLLHGHLLEYKYGDRTVMHMAPTLAQALRATQVFA